MCQVVSRNASKTSLVDGVTVVEHNSMLVCWHPEPKFPYEYSKPIPKAESDTDSVLKVQNNEEVKELFRVNHPYFTNKKLQKITGTTKHLWFPRLDRRFAKRNPPRDREYL
ncbi:mitochondrial ribosomal protein L42 isoform X2 [Oratosquilla oratoria]|uniref:mitochondrial ribosomal protein L42 isoform X2 n=1 Tax=Oratosquilla oratoria TaxID=337810 RepID=UPI003F767D95